MPEVKKISQDTAPPVYAQITGATAATVYGGWHEMTNFDYILGYIKATAITGGGITKLEIVGNDEADGSGNTFVVYEKDFSVIGNPDAVDDETYIETDGSNIIYGAQEAGFTPKSAAIRVTLDNAADEFDLIILKRGARFSGDLIVDKIA